MKDPVGRQGITALKDILDYPVYVSYCMHILPPIQKSHLLTDVVAWGKELQAV
jgi:hypothetical protein